MTTLIQRSFAGGELDPALHSRVDTVKYATGAKTLRNMLVKKSGGVQNKPGSEFVCEVKDSTKTVRMIPFVFNSDQTYILEFGNLYMRVIRDGSQVTLTAQNIVSITNANPCVIIYDGSDTYAEGDEVYISGITTAIGRYLNGRTFKVGTVNTTANTFQLKYMDGTAVNSTSFGSYSSGGGTIAEVYTITTPYLEADLDALSFAQNADVITIVHPSYSPRELSRSGHSSWTLSTITFGPAISSIVNSLGFTGTAGAATARYAVTAVSISTGEETIPLVQLSASAITAATKANPVVITSAGHGLTDNHLIYISGVVGMTELNGRVYVIDVLSVDTFALVGVDGTGYGTYTSGGTLGDASPISTSIVDPPTSGNPHTVSWTSVPGAGSYNVYKESNGIYGYVGSTTKTSFVNSGTTPDVADSIAHDRSIFLGTGNYPSTVNYIQDRLVFANSDNEPEAVWGSRIGLYKNFLIKPPISDDQPVTFGASGRQVNEVRHLVDLGSFSIFTTSGEHIAQGNSSGFVTPAEVNRKQYSYNGTGVLPPIVVNNRAFYLQALGNVIRDFGADYQVSGYQGDDISMFGTHLLEGYTITDWAFQLVPNSILWAVRSDGKLLGMTYVKEHEILAWHQHDTDGDYENVCTIPEGTEYAVYVVVKRTIDGATKRYIERWKSRYVDPNHIENMAFVESCLTYDGRNTNGSHTMTLSGGTNWTYDETLTLTSSTSYFTSSDVGNAIHMYIEDDDGLVTDTVRCEITEYTSVTVVSVRPHKTVPVALRSATDDWAEAVDEITGLWHIEGENVSVFADSVVVASPNNEDYGDVLTVENGSITLDRPYAVIHVGLPMTSDLETLDIDSADGETMSNKRKLVNQVTLRVEKTRGVFVGPKPPSDDTEDPLENLTEAQMREAEDYDEAVDLLTGKLTVNIKPEWNSNGRVFIRQVDPLPMTILSVSPTGSFPGSGRG